MRILVAEDEKMARFALHTSLVSWGYEVIEAEDGKTALEILESEDCPGMAILDWAMPGINGLEVCKKIREVEKDREKYVYIIFVTGKQEFENMVEGFEAGVDDYIIKPFEPMELRARVKAGVRILDLQEKLRQAKKQAGAENSENGGTPG